MKKIWTIFLVLLLMSCGNHDVQSNSMKLLDLANVFNQRMLEASLPYRMPTRDEDYAKSRIGGADTKVKLIGKGIAGYWTLNQEGDVTNIEVHESTFDRHQSDQEIRDDINAIMAVLTAGLNMDNNQADHFVDEYRKNYKFFLSESQNNPNLEVSFNDLGRTFKFSLVRNAGENELFENYIRYQAQITR